MGFINQYEKASAIADTDTLLGVVDGQTKQVEKEVLLADINSNLTSEISRAKETEETLKSRIDTISSLPEGSTTGDAELQDIRVKADGTIAENAGNAVREQFSELKSDLTDLESKTSEIANSNLMGNTTFVVGYVDENGIYFDNNTNYVVSDYIPVRTGDYYLKRARFVTIYNSNKERIDGLSLKNDALYNVFSVSVDGYVRITIPKRDYDANVYSMTLRNGSFFGNETKANINNSIHDETKSIAFYNLFNGATLTDGYTNGTEVNTDNIGTYMFTSPICIKSGVTYTFNRFRFANFYNTSMDLISTISSGKDDMNVSITPSNDGYMIVTIYKSDVDKGINYCRENDTGKYFSKESYRELKGLNGIKIYNFGDSIAAGDGNNGVGYAELLKDYGAIVTDYAVGGATVSYVTEQSMHSVYGNQIFGASDELPDIILIEGGANDFTQGRTLGEISAYDDYGGDYDATTYLGAIESCFYRLTRKYLGVPIIWVFCHQHGRHTHGDLSFYEMHDKSLEVCKKWSVKVVDIFNDGILNTNLPLMKNAYTNNGDSTHPNELGYKKFYVPPIINAIKSVIN